VRKNIDLMNEIMSENEPGKENPEDLQLLDVSLQGGRGLWVWLVGVAGSAATFCGHGRDQFIARG